MPGWIESRILLAERSIEDLYRRLRDLVDAVKAVRQQLMAQSQQQPAMSTPSDGGGGVFVCYVPGVYTGNPPTATAPFSAVVYQLPGFGSKGTQNIYVGIPGPTVANRWGYCLPDGSGAYVLISQSCT